MVGSYGELQWPGQQLPCRFLETMHAILRHACRDTQRTARCPVHRPSPGRSSGINGAFAVSRAYLVGTRDFNSSTQLRTTTMLAGVDV
jgi:hypothetical protein